MADAGMNMRGFSGALSTMYKEGAKTAKSIEQRFQRIGGKMQSVGGKMTAGLTLPLAGAGAMALKTAAKYERLEIQLSTLVGSAEKGAKIFKQIKEFSAGTPFQIEDLVKANNTLIGMGQNSEDAFANLQMLGDVASATGANVNELAITFGQASAEGRLMTRDIREFISRGVPMTKMLADSMGVAKSEIFDLASQGRITFDVLQQALTDATSGTGRYTRATEAMANTLTGVWSTFTDNVGQMAGQIGTDLVEAFDLKDLLKTVTSNIKQMTDWFSNLSSTTKKVIFGITGLVAAAGPLIAGLGTLVTLMPVLVTGFAALTSPISLAIGAVGALAAAAGYLYSNWDAVKDSFNRIFISMKNSVALFVAESIAVLNEFFGRLPGMQQLFGGAEQWARSFIEQLPDKEDAVEFKGFGESMGDTLSSVMGMFGGAKAKATGDAKAIAAAAMEALRKAKKLAGGGGKVNPFAGDDNPIQQATAGLKRFKSQVTVTKDQYKAGMNQIKSASTEGGSIAEAAFAKTSQAMDQASQAGQRMGNAIGNALSQAVLHGKNLIDTVKNLVKQFASRLFVKGITMLISGGFSGGFSFGKLFKGLFHTGGIVPGTGNQPIIAKGGEGVFTKGQMAAMGNLQSRQSGPSISESGIQRAFEKAFANKMSKLGPSEIFAMTQQGSRGY